MNQPVAMATSSSSPPPPSERQDSRKRPRDNVVSIPGIETRPNAVWLSLSRETIICHDTIEHIFIKADVMEIAAHLKHLIDVASRESISIYADYVDRTIMLSLRRVLSELFKLRDEQQGLSDVSGNGNKGEHQGQDKGRDSPTARVGLLDRYANYATLARFVIMFIIGIQPNLWTAVMKDTKSPVQRNELGVALVRNIRQCQLITVIHYNVWPLIRMMVSDFQIALMVGSPLPPVTYERLDRWMEVEDLHVRNFHRQEAMAREASASPRRA